MRDQPKAKKPDGPEMEIVGLDAALRKRSAMASICPKLVARVFASSWP